MYTQTAVEYLQIRPQANTITQRNRPEEHTVYNLNSIVRHSWTVVDMPVKPGNKKSRIEAWESDNGWISGGIFSYPAIVGKYRRAICQVEVMNIGQVALMCVGAWKPQ